jgi:hypothetical protein
LLLPDFSQGGFDKIDMTPPQVNGSSGAFAILATTGGSRTDDDVFVVSDVPLHCSSGVGTTRLHGVSGGVYVSYGNAYGLAYFGGDDTYPCPATYPTTIASAATIEGHRLVVAGRRITYAPPSADTSEYEVAIVRTDDGQTLDDRTQQLLMSNGEPRIAGSQGWSDVAGNGSGEFFLTGSLLAPNTGVPIFGTTRIASDRIMGSSFE